MTDLGVVVRILQIGFSGLAFLLAYLSYLIVNREQKRDKPDQRVLDTSLKFMWFSLALACTNVVAQLGETGLKAWIASREAVVRADGKIDANAVQQSLSSFREALQKTNDRISGIKLAVVSTSTSPDFGCGVTQVAEQKRQNVMYGSRDGTSCKIPNVNYYKEIGLRVPQ